MTYPYQYNDWELKRYKGYLITCVGCKKEFYSELKSKRHCGSALCKKKVARLNVLEKHNSYSEYRNKLKKEDKK